jgi:riboflavin synthase
VQLGESIAVEGVCLTVAAIEDGVLAFDVLAETFRRTTLGGKPIGATLNLERALRADGRLGGHIVNGHVDGVGTVEAFEPAGRDRILTIRAEPELMDGIVYKGCVSVSGVSLTVASLDPRTFALHLIPETLSRTSLAGLAPGDQVNLEIDIVGKYVKHYLEQGTVMPDISWEQLRRQGLLRNP